MHKKLTTVDNTMLTMSSSLTDLNKSWTEFSNRLPQLELMYNEVQMMINILPTGLSLTALQHLQKLNFVLWLTLCVSTLRIRILSFAGFTFYKTIIPIGLETLVLGIVITWHCESSVSSLWERAVCLHWESSVSSLWEQCVFTERAVCLHWESSVSSLWKQYVFTVSVVYLHCECCVFTVRAVCLHWESGVSSLWKQCVFTVKAVCLHCESSVSSLGERCVFNVRVFFC